MKKLLFVLLICFTVPVFGSKISSAYKALSIYDYFKAKELLYASLSKNTCEASYGLATIFYRTDNPFTNIDSAAKYIAKSNATFKDTITLSHFFISKQTIYNLTYLVSIKGYETYAAKKNTQHLNYFLQRFYFSSDTLLQKAIMVRDELSFEKYNFLTSSDSMCAFLLTYPESYLYNKAKNAFYDFQYTENTSLKSEYQYKTFIKNYPQNTHIVSAEYSLFELTKQLHNTDSLYNFIKNYSSLTCDEAWKMLYSISVKKYNKTELNNFLNKYPEYPYKENIEKEISLAQHVLYPLKNNNDKYGYIDTLGNWIIKPIYDDAAAFIEGFAGVCKADSCFYIDKEGVKTSELYFEETGDYFNGIAIVKKKNNFYLINRSGQLITKGFEDINDVSDNLFVCKTNGLYGAINNKGETIVPFTYNKLGNFKNGYAYYLSSKYGLVDTHNNTLKAQWDWISEIDTNNLVIVKQGLKFGLMQLNETLLLPPEFDYITHCVNNIYLITKNNLYGFYNAKEKCYITDIAYDFDKSFNNDYYTNGKQFKLIEDEEIALTDANGRLSINFGTYANVFFAKDDIIRIQKGKRFGYVDRKLKSITPIEYDRASDFENNTAIITKQNNTQLINKAGKPLFSIKDGLIEKNETELLTVTINDLNGLINNKGEMLLITEFNALKHINGAFWSCIKNNELFLYNSHNKTLIKITTL